MFTRRYTDKSRRPARVFSPYPVHGYLYAVGGTTGTLSNYNGQFSITANAFATKGAMTAARLWHFAATIGNRIYHVGGENPAGTVKSENYEYDRAGNAWATKTSMTAAKGQGSGQPFTNDAAHFIGGYIAAAVDTNYRYSKSADSWSTKTVCSTGKRIYANGTGTLGDTCYLSHGIDTVGTENANIYEYSQSGDSWATKTAGATVRHGPAGGTIGVDKLYVVAGYTGAANTNATEEFSKVGNAWTTKTVVDLGRRYLAGSIGGNNTMYVDGGYTTTYVANHTEYSRTANAWTVKNTVSSRYGLSMTGI